MDYNDDFSPRRLEQETTAIKQRHQHHNDKEDAENHLVGNFQHALLEENANNEWRPLNGLRQQGMYDYQEQQIHQQQQQYDEHVANHTDYHDNVSSSVHYGITQSSDQGGPFNDILNSNRQNMEGSHMKKITAGNSYESSNKYGRMHNLPMLSEDLRISKIIRRLMVENNRKAAIDLCKKLETAVRNQSNVSYICRSFEILFDNMLTVLRQCPLECLENASSILGIMGYINRYDFAVYKGHLTKAYGNYKNIRKYLMMALKTTLRCDAVNLDLKTYSERLLGLLKEYLENAEVSENFISISETIAEFSKNYKTSFQRHFTDIVDIIVGWHLEVEQPAELKRHCSKVLQQFAEYFLNELDFTFGLLGQFIEDIEACREDILAEEDDTAVTRQQSEIRVGSFIGAFTSIVKALASKGVNLNEFDTAAHILSNAKEAVNKVAKICFDMIPLLSEETVVNLNEFYCMILLYDRSVENLNAFETIIQLQLRHLSSFNDNQQSSFLYMVLNIVRQYRTQLPLSFITLLMGTDCLVLQDIKLSCGLKTCKLLMKIYHEILIIKNVPLLQEAYRHILVDVNKTVASLNTVEGTADSMMRCEMLLNFYLAALTALACQTSSIIGMYALKPSILELLIKNCQASNYALWGKYPTLHRALLELIIDHCMKNHNFRQSSRLLKQHQDSPSSENFAKILKFLGELLKWHVSEKIFKWLENILQECLEDFEVLIKNKDFLHICENITLAVVKQPLMCSTIIESLLTYPQIPERILSNIRDIALCIVESSDKKLAAAYCKILSQLPLEICLTPNYDKQFYGKNKEKLFTLYQWHKSSACFNGLRPKYFKTFLESLDPNAHINSALYPSLIEKSSCNLQREHFVEYLKSVQDNQQLLSYHLQYEAARYCVQHKLRTTLGKPQETFLAIEAVIMKYARFLAEKEGLPLSYKNLQNVMEVQENCRMLLGFLECLEKHIYNAAEGTAYAMLPAEKPAKTFFRVNAPTCREWFKRIRTAVNLISIHCMEPEMVIRYSENILQIEANHSNLALLDRTVTSLVWALYNCGESDTLYGITTWLKSKHGKRFEWIQYVAEQASGHLEKAATGYLYTLHDENNKSMDSYMKEFIQKQLTECFYHTARWSEIPAITQETIYSKQHLQIMENIYQSVGYQQYNWQNEELTTALVELTEWPEELTNKEKTNYTPKLETYSYYEVLRKLQDSCIINANSTDLKQGVYESVRNSVQQGIREGLLRSYEPGFNNNQLNELMILNHITQKLHLQQNINISYKSNCLDTKMSSLLLSKCLYWSLLKGQQESKQQYELLLNLSSKSRLENNLNYCQSLLSQFFKLKHINLPLNEIAQQLKMNELNVDYNDTVLVQGIEELVKCLQAQTTSIADALELGSACCSEVIQLQRSQEKEDNISYFPESITNLLLTMADWLTIHRLNNTNLTSGQQFQKLQQQLPEIACCAHSDSAKANVLPSSEYAVGKLLNASILCKQNSGEAWFSYGNWCYRWGKKLMETKSTEQSSSVSVNDLKDLKLTKRNVASIQDILKDKFDADSIQQVVDVLNNHILNAMNYDNTEDLDSNTTENTTEILELELKNVCSLNVEQLNGILTIWRQAQKGVYGFYEEATRAYFKYLAIESESVAKKSDVANSDNNEVEDCTFVTTTLRLLRLIVKHAIGLQDVLEEGLRNTPLRPWKVIVPQLFSRLNHHEPYVRQSLAELLCRLAVNQPQLIIFPAVVGAQQELKHRNNADTQVQLSNCFGTLLNSLAEQAPETVLQVQLLVKELRRITLLWDEYWIHSLSQLYAEYSPLYNALDAEAKKSNNSELKQAKYEVFRQHLLSDFKQITAITEKEPETNYERSFQERFGSYIEAVLKDLEKNIEESKPSEYWQKIKQLYNIFQQRPLRGNSSTLRISEISPVLANMHNTTIAMPGVDTYEQPAVYIKSVDATALIFISTKTKPKKLSFYGSNGQRYTYLFKGQEDLHLDERIMQFLSISNSMMARSYGSKAKTDCFKANHYSVIPLGSRSGLIRWVDNCSPLFAIYKKWQQRDALLKQQQKERQSSAKGQEQIQQSPVAANATRPSELFYNKLTPLLAECNLKVTDPRRQWPMSVLKRVLKELSNETPKDLLSKEIWCYSANAVEWRKSVRRYSMSLAVMSIIGYVIGLGDRHLDNVLIKLATGEILHIDYSVCFEKGKTLRVPERVPFRMTQNLKDALGLVGTEGAFRLACTHVLKILRKERETLLTLLEAFVYDPLVDWTVSDDGTTTVSRRTTAHSAANIIASLDTNTTAQHLSPKSLYNNKKQEVDLSRQTMALRITEIKPTWMKYKNDFDVQLNELDLHLQNVLDYRKNILQLEQERDNFTKQQAMVRELEALGSAQTSHAFIQRYNIYKHDLENYNKIKLMVQKTSNELDLLLLTYFNIITNPEAMHNIEVNPKGNDIVDHNESEFDVIKDLLIDNNWNNVYVQAKFNRHEMENTFIQTQRSALECRDLLTFYSRVMQFYPRSQLQNYRLMKYKRNFANLMGIEEKSNDAGIVECNIEHCCQYFECMKMISIDLQKNIVQAKQILDEHKQQPIIDSSLALNAINEFVSLNPSYNSQILIVCMLRHILQASQVFHHHEQSLKQNRDYFLPNKQHSFLQLINTFISSIYTTYNNPLPNNEILHLLITSLEAICFLRETMEAVIGKLFSIFMMDDNIELQDVLNNFDSNMNNEILEKHAQLNNIFKNIDAAVGKLEISLKMLQDKILYILEVAPNELLELSTWNINISNFTQKLSTDLKITLVGNLRHSIESFKTNDINNIYDIRKIRYALDDLVFTIQSTLFEGLLSYAIQSINHNITSTLIPLETVNEIDLSNADLLCGNLYVALQHESLILSDDFVVIHHSKLLEEYQLITTAYYWLNESHLKELNDAHAFITSKQEFLTRLHKIYQVLVVWKSTMLKIQADLELHRHSFKDLIQSLTSSDDLIMKQQQFDDAINFINQRYQFFLNLCISLSEYSAVLLQFEMCSDEQSFENLLKLFADVRQEWLQSESSITVVERNLVQLLDPEDKIDQYWIENVSGLLDEMIFSVQKKISDMEKEDQTMQNILVSDGQQMQPLLNSTLRLDLRQLLKMLTKLCKQTTKTDSEELCQDLRDIQQSLKLLHAKLNELQAQLFSRVFDSTAIQQMQEKIKELHDLCHRNNEDLNKLLTRFMQMDTEREQQGSADSPIKTASQNDLANKEVINSQVGEQKRNAYAVSVWKRIRMKLEGRDPDHNRRSSVAEQVDFVIREATSEENLASLYEGWTPWV
ncbi:serine/threonine-protein kinase Smg1 [Lucilia sericata]|uniref:serine/threonine-protein kinase Smg1 n=1 Tax=Lucilia sericata TaxID=13632 RepID=UPI0018A83CEE|nr:serine/threonine-protein kinase Smg1 [Lucilia sericata]XP_037824920.1 serine/threonine-protein kinase Smg1 [Lucilia sericata]